MTLDDVTYDDFNTSIYKRKPIIAVKGKLYAICNVYDKLRLGE